MLLKSYLSNPLPLLPQSSRLTREHAESVLRTERERWAQEKAESQQALRATQAELSRVRHEAVKDVGASISVSGHESEGEVTWPRSKVGSL